MNHLWQGKVFTIPGPVLNYGGLDIGGAQLCQYCHLRTRDDPFFDIGMPHAWSGGDALIIEVQTNSILLSPLSLKTCQQLPPT